MPTPPDSPRPNLLYIMCDELRWCDLGCYGSTQRRRDGSLLTPALDALAQRGVRFETAVSNCPVCVPARSIVLSGQYASRCLGATTNPGLTFESSHSRRPRKGWLFEAYAPDERVAFPDPTLPELLRAAGYQTRAIGKWHVDAWPHHLGFEHYVIPRAHHAHSGQLFTEDGGPEFAAPGFSVDYERDRVCRFLASPEARGGRPWFLYYNISPPHMPLADMPERYLSLIDPAAVSLRGNVPRPFDVARHLETFRVYLWDYRRYLNRMPHTQQVEPFDSLEALTALYLAATAWVDDTVAAVLQQLRDQGLDDHTLVIFTSDHGDMLGSHDRFGKGQLLEESYRVPLIAAGPNVQPRSVGAGVASLLDIAPTLLGAAGLPNPTHMPGQDLTGALAGQTPGPEHAIIEAIHGKQIGVRTPDRLEVFDLPASPLGPVTPTQVWQLRSDQLQQRPLPPSNVLTNPRAQAWADQYLPSRLA